MSSRKYRLHDGMKGAALAVRVTPRASRNEIVEILSDGTVKVHVTAPPVEGKANEALIDFMSEILDVPPSRIEVVAGASGRDKLISVLDMDAATLHQKIIENIS
ncbi:MAG: DUF167 domain-containing protein [Anaerolineales bacterium]|nr:DUF167 domain-containing protein [Anaerolineales bacterium]